MTPTDLTAISARRVSKRFGTGDATVHALHEVSVDIQRNEFFTLLGPSGCGKTTLLRLIAGFEFPSDGEILLNGTDIAGLPPYQRPVNTVFQNYALFPHMSVEQNIAFGLLMLDKPRDEIEQRVQQMLTLVRMESLRHRAISEISGGQQQRVALARALAPGPQVLLLDEPLSALDFKLRKEMQIELKRMQSETGITFIFVTHDQEEALTMSDRIAVLSAGEILQIGSPHDIYEHPADRFVASFIGESNFLQGRVASTDNGQTRVQLNSGNTIQASTQRAADHDPVIQGDTVTLVVRPEHARLLTELSNAALTGRVENIVYSGTDTRFHVRLDGVGKAMPEIDTDAIPGASIETSANPLFVVRSQNQRGGGTLFNVQQPVGIEIDHDAVQILH